MPSSIEARRVTAYSGGEGRVRLIEQIVDRRGGQGGLGPGLEDGEVVAGVDTRPLAVADRQAAGLQDHEHGAALASDQPLLAAFPPAPAVAGQADLAARLVGFRPQE